MCCEKAVGTEGGKGILLVFAFSSAIVHLDFRTYKGASPIGSESHTGWLFPEQERDRQED